MGDSSRAQDGSQSSMEGVLGALVMFMEQQRASTSGQGATRALKGVVDKVSRFDGKDITRFLKMYTCEMEVHQVNEGTMMETFCLAVVPEVRERVQEILQHEHVTSWATFEEKLKDEYFDEDTERMTKRSFLDWVDQQPGKHMGPNELLREFEKKYNQLPLAERRILDTRKADLFLQAANDALEDRLLLLLGDRSTEGGFTNDWKRVEETVILVAKQQRVRSRGIAIPTEVAPKMAPKTPASSSKEKSVDDGTLEELIKGIRELKVEMKALKRDTKPSSSQPVGGQKAFVVRCIWCDDPGHKRPDCDSYADAMKNGIVTFKEGRIRDATTDEPLETNFGRGGMKKLMDERLKKSSSSRGKEAETYSIEVEQGKVRTSSHVSREVMVRGAEAIRSLTGWDDPVDLATIKAYLVSEQGVDLPIDASVEVKRGRAADEEETEEPASKKKPPNGRGTPSGEGPANRTRQKQEAGPSSFHPGDAPLPKDKWEERMSNEKGKSKEGTAKGKGKAPAYKLQSDIESSIDMKGILEERILDAKIEFTLREALGIAKKDFHELIIDVIKRKRQMTAETVMARALDSHMTEDEEDEIGQVFAMMSDHADTDGAKVEEVDEILDAEMEDEVLRMFSFDFVAKNTMAEVKKSTEEIAVTCCMGGEYWGDHESETMRAYTQSYWARATTEAHVKLGDLNEPILALVDHGSEINIISRKTYEKGKWPIDVNHGWVLRVANNERGGLYGACPAVKVKVGDVEVEQNFFVQNNGTYPIILGQPYITATRMGTKVLDDGSHYARVRSPDGQRAVQFLTVRPDHKRHRAQLRDAPMISEDEEFQGF